MSSAHQSPNHRETLQAGELGWVWFINGLHEGCCASQLRHLGLVPEFETGRDSGVIFLVYEFITSINLSQQLAQVPVPWWEALEITRQIIEATAHAHAA